MLIISHADPPPPGTKAKDLPPLSLFTFKNSSSIWLKGSSKLMRVGFKPGSKKPGRGTATLGALHDYTQATPIEEYMGRLVEPPA